jgi:hypothetical protein
MRGERPHPETRLLGVSALAGTLSGGGPGAPRDQRFEQRLVLVIVESGRLVQLAVAKVQTATELPF